MDGNGATIRRAGREDLEAIVALYADDEASARPGDVGSVADEGYARALEALATDPDNGVYVAELDGDVIGTFQLTFIRQLSYRGCLVAQVESVHVHSRARAQGVGTAMLEWAIGEARRRGCLRIQLTSNVRRERAHRFYERLGFSATHRGMKLYLSSNRGHSQSAGS